MDKAGVSRTGLRKRQRGKQGEFTRCQGGRLGFPLRITESRWGEHWRERRKEGGKLGERRDTTKKIVYSYLRSFLSSPAP